MTLDEAIKRYTNNAEYERTHNNLQGCLEFKQLAEWLRELKEYRKFYSCYNCYNASASFNEYPCNVCRRGLEATKNIKDHYKEVNADDE